MTSDEPGSTDAAPTTDATASSRADRLIDRSLVENKSHPNDGRNTFIVGRDRKVYGLIAARVGECQSLGPGSFYEIDNGCFLGVSVEMQSSVNDLPVNPVDFYILGRDNRRYNYGEGDALFVDIQGRRLGLGNLNRSEIAGGVLTFDAPAHGRLVYDPSYSSNTRVVWEY